MLNSFSIRTLIKPKTTALQLSVGQKGYAIRYYYEIFEQIWWLGLASEFQITDVVPINNPVPKSNTIMARALRQEIAV
jgi:hypothetical protein